MSDPDQLDPQDTETLTEQDWKDIGCARCLFCTWAEQYDSTDPGAVAHAEAMLIAHVWQCAGHPLLVRARAAEARVRELEADRDAIWQALVRAHGIDAFLALGPVGAVRGLEAALKQAEARAEQLQALVERLAEAAAGEGVTCNSCCAQTYTECADAIAAMLIKGDSHE